MNKVSPSRQRRQTSLQVMEGRLHMYISKRRGAKTDPCGRPFFRSRSLLGLLSPVVSPNKFHVLVRQKSQQLAGEVTLPDRVISNCQIDKHGPSLFCLKRILNVLCKQNDLIYGRLSVSKSSLFFWKQGVDYWLDRWRKQE